MAVNMAQMFRRFAEAIRGEDVDAHPDFREAARRHHTLDALRRATETGWPGRSRVIGCIWRRAAPIRSDIIVTQNR